MEEGNPTQIALASVRGPNVVGQPMARIATSDASGRQPASPPAAAATPTGMNEDLEMWGPLSLTKTAFFFFFFLFFFVVFCLLGFL